MDKPKIWSIVGIVIVVLIVFTFAGDPKTGTFSDVLRSLGNHQEQFSDELTQHAVAGVEGELVGEHKVDGSNWSLPNILRFAIGLD